MYKITAETLQATLNYLAKRPFLEVNELIGKLANLEKLEEKKEATPKNIKN